MEKELIYIMDDRYEEYLTDESKYKGNAVSISFPESEEEIISIITRMRVEGKNITIQGGKTGIVGGAVAENGHIMNLSRMNRHKEHIFLEDGTCLLTVEPGINLMDLKKVISRISRKMPLFWPSEPTEASATVGGIAATGANGICSYLYGDSKQYIHGIKMIGFNGKVYSINRGEEFRMVHGEKVDLLELLLGKEGITGVFCELTVRLIPKPKSIWGISFFFESKEDVGFFVQKLKTGTYKTDTASIAAAEYIDRTSIDMIEARKGNLASIKELPDIEKEYMNMIYLELHGEEEGIEELAELLMESAIEANSDPDQAWAVSEEREVERMRSFRHAAAETTNLFIEEMRRTDPRITKLGTDMSLSNADFMKVIKHYEEDVENSNLKSCIFGHVFDNHMHVNILPKSFEEYTRGIELMKKWMQEVLKEEGSVVGEHGIGKLKKEFFFEYIPKDYIQVCKDLKQEFDPNGFWNPGNIFDSKAGVICE